MRMNYLGLATAALAAAACFSAPALADGFLRGSVKDAPVMVSSPGHCYFRADVGYSWSQNPDVKWTVTDPDPGPTQWQFVTDRVTNVSIDNTWFAKWAPGAALARAASAASSCTAISASATSSASPAPGPCRPRSAAHRSHDPDVHVQRLL